MSNITKLAPSNKSYQIKSVKKPILITGLKASIELQLFSTIVSIVYQSINVNNTVYFYINLRKL